MHADLAKSAHRYATAEAAEALLGAYLENAGAVPARKLATLFKDVLSRDEIEQALGRLSEKKR